MFVCFFQIPKEKEALRESFSGLTLSGRAQVSLEYLVLLAAFFGVLAILFPVVSDSVSNFLFSSDVILAKRISVDVGESSSLLAFLGDGSSFSKEYFPSKSISISSQGTKLVVRSGEKSFLAETGSPQVFPKSDFAGKFTLTILKSNNNIRITADSNFSGEDSPD